MHPIHSQFSSNIASMISINGILYVGCINGLYIKTYPERVVILNTRSRILEIMKIDLNQENNSSKDVSENNFNNDHDSSEENEYVPQFVAIMTDMYLIILYDDVVVQTHSYYGEKKELDVWNLVVSHSFICLCNRKTIFTFKPNTELIYKELIEGRMTDSLIQTKIDASEIEKRIKKDKFRGIETVVNNKTEHSYFVPFSVTYNFDYQDIDDLRSFNKNKYWKLTNEYKTKSSKIIGTALLKNIPVFSTNKGKIFFFDVEKNKVKKRIHLYSFDITNEMVVVGDRIVTLGTNDNIKIINENGTVEDFPSKNIERPIECIMSCNNTLYIKANQHLYKINFIKKEKKSGLTSFFKNMSMKIQGNEIKISMLILGFGYYSPEQIIIHRNKLISSAWNQIIELKNRANDFVSDLGSEKIFGFKK